MLRPVLGSTIPGERLGVLKRILMKLEVSNPEGEMWCKRLEDVLNKGLTPKPPESSKRRPMPFFGDDPGFC